MTQIYTILFDLDGTIVNTAPDLMAAHNHVMKKFGHTEKKLSDIKSLAGRGAWVMMQRSFKEEINGCVSITVILAPVFPMYGSGISQSWANSNKGNIRKDK